MLKLKFMYVAGVFATQTFKEPSCVTFDFLRVCSLWKEIALIMRDREFNANEEHMINIFDTKVGAL